MATSTTLKPRTSAALERIVEVVKDFAKKQNWKSGEYEIWFRVLEDWGRISFILVADDLGSRSNHFVWNELFDHLENKLFSGSDIGFSLGFSVRKKEEVEQGAMHSIPEGYVRAEELLPRMSLTD